MSNPMRLRAFGSSAVLIISVLFSAAQKVPRKPVTAPEKGPLNQLPYTPSLDLTAMDKTVDPCVDFYTYSCGGWRTHNPIPPDQAAWSVYGKLTDDNQRFLWGILQEAAQATPQRSAVQQKIGDMFASCMDESAIEKLGATPLRGHLDSIAGMTSVKDLPSVLAPLHQAAGNAGP